jgi:pimeloyl-ACP methyl ester carboxylesterase
MVNGIALHRMGSGPPIALFHGGSGSWRHFAANLAPLAKSHTVIAVDMPGLGDSADAARTITLDEYLTRMTDALDQVLGRDAKLSLGAFSVGGLMATAIATRLGPRVTHLALCAVGGYWPDEIVTLDLKGPRRGMSDDEIRAIHRHNLGVLMFADPSRIDEYAVTLQGENVARNRFDTRLLGLKHHISLFLPKVTCPVMMIFGGRDNLSGPHIGERIALCRSLKPDAEIHVLADVGHWVCYEGADRVNPLLIRFLDRNR